LLEILKVSLKKSSINESDDFQLMKNILGKICPEFGLSTCLHVISEVVMLEKTPAAYRAFKGIPAIKSADS
jgi:hypothetical protein